MRSPGLFFVGMCLLSIALPVGALLGYSASGQGFVGQLQANGHAVAPGAAVSLAGLVSLLAYLVVGGTAFLACRRFGATARNTVSGALLLATLLGVLAWLR
jgi:hypothetical protein